MESFPNGRTLQVNESLFLFQHIIPICLSDVSPSLPYALVWWCTGVDPTPVHHQINTKFLGGLSKAGGQWCMEGDRSWPVPWSEPVDRMRKRWTETWRMKNRTAIAMGFLRKMISHVHFTDIWYMCLVFLLGLYWVSPPVIIFLGKQRTTLARTMNTYLQPPLKSQSPRFRKSQSLSNGKGVWSTVRTGGLWGI